MEQLQLKDFLNYTYLSQPNFAPGGKSAAFIATKANEEENNYESRLWLYDGQLRQLTDLGKEGRYQWEDETHILFPAVRSAKEKKRAEAREQFTSFYRLDIHGGEALPAFTLPFAVQKLEHLHDDLWMALGSIDANYPDYYKMNDTERAEIAKHYKEEQDYEVFDESPFWFNGAGVVNKQRTALFLVHMDSMEISRVTEPLFDVDGMAVLDGKVYFTGEAYTAKPKWFSLNVFCLDPENGNIHTLVENAPLQGQIKAVGNKLWLLATSGQRHGLNENNWIYDVDIQTGAITLLRQEEYSLYSSVGSDCRYGGGNGAVSKDGKLFCTSTREGNSHLYMISGKDAVPVLEKDGSIDSFTMCEEHNTALLVAMYDNRLQELYAFDLCTKDLKQLSHFNDAAVHNKYIASCQPMTVQSQGYQIGGWVLLPKDYDKTKSYPAVLDIHGGPKTVYGPVFYHEMQLWANMGYFVFFCNPKGGDGRDNEFMDIRGHYGETDYQNLMDFTDAVLEAYPQIDRTKVCVTGGSYGGFMTNWIIGHTNRFCCAASQRSISNWLSFYGVSDIGPHFAADQCDGTPFTDAKKLWDHSPMKYAPNVTTPTLFIHSDEDYRCPLDQGIQMYTSLVEHGVPARLCMFHGETHELSRSGKPKHRIRRLTEITNWFEKYAK